MATQLNDIKSSEWGLSLNEVGKVAQGLDDIKQCVKIILETVPGSDPLRPDFGCGIFEHLDRPINEAIADIKKSVVVALTAFEQRIEKIKVAINLNVEQLTISVTFQVKNTVNIGQTDVTYGLTNS